VALGKANEHRINLIKDQFTNVNTREIKDDDIFKQIKENNEKKDHEQQQKDKSRKVKEMEAKFFQDN